MSYQPNDDISLLGMCALTIYVIVLVVLIIVIFN